MRARETVAGVVLVVGAAVAVVAFLVAGLGVVLAVAAALATLVIAATILRKR